MSLVDVDDRGRVVLPKDLREELGIRPGGKVAVERAGEAIVIRPALPMRDALRRLRAAVAAVPRSAKGARLDPLRLKEMWDVDARLR